MARRARHRWPVARCVCRASPVRSPATPRLCPRCRLRWGYAMTCARGLWRGPTSRPRLRHGQAREATARPHSVAVRASTPTSARPSRCAVCRLRGDRGVCDGRPVGDTTQGAIVECRPIAGAHRGILAPGCNPGCDASRRALSGGIGQPRTTGHPQASRSTFHAVTLHVSRPTREILEDYAFTLSSAMFCRGLPLPGLPFPRKAKNEIAE